MAPGVVIAGADAAILLSARHLRPGNQRLEPRPATPLRPGSGFVYHGAAAKPAPEYSAPFNLVP